MWSKDDRTDPSLWVTCGLFCLASLYPSGVAPELPGIWWLSKDDNDADEDDTESDEVVIQDGLLQDEAVEKEKGGEDGELSDAA